MRWAGLKDLIGGARQGNTGLLPESPGEAVERMQAAAEQSGANAVVLMQLHDADSLDPAAMLLPGVYNANFNDEYLIDAIHRCSHQPFQNAPIENHSPPRP